MRSHSLFFSLFSSSRLTSKQSGALGPVSTAALSNYRRAHLLYAHAGAYRQKTAARSSLSVRANCLNVWLLPWNMSEKLIMWLHSDSRYELWMNFSPLDQRTVVYQAGGSSGCLSLATRASPLCHTCATSASKHQNQRRWIDTKKTWRRGQQSESNQSKRFFFCMKLERTLLAAACICSTLKPIYASWGTQFLH